MTSPWHLSDLNFLEMKVCQTIQCTYRMVHLDFLGLQGYNSSLLYSCIWWFCSYKYIKKMNPAVLQIKGKYCISTHQVSNKLKKKVLRFFFWQSVFNTRKVFSYQMEQNSNTELFNQYMVCKGNLLSVSTPFVLTLKNTARGKKLYICSYLENLVSKVSDHRSRDFQHFLRDS